MTERLIEYLNTLVPLCDIKKPQLRKDLLKNTLLGKMPAGKILYYSGAWNEYTFYLLAGELTLTDSEGKQSILNSDDPHCRFPVGYDQSHKYTVKTHTEVYYLKINSETLDALLTWDQINTPLLRQPNKPATDENQVNWMSRILELDIFQQIPPVNIQAMFLRFETIEVEQDEVIIEQGDTAEYYYVVKAGRCAVYRTGTDSNATAQQLAELGPGDSFGEEALVADRPRNASVIMLENGELARLSKQNFSELLQDPIMKSITYAEAQQQLAAGGRFIDVRTQNEHRHNHLPDSLNLPLDSLREQLAHLDKNTIYIVYCDTGSRSAAATYILNQHGFSAYLLENGLNQVPSDAIVHS